MDSLTLMSVSPEGRKLMISVFRTFTYRCHPGKFLLGAHTTTSHISEYNLYSISFIDSIIHIEGVVIFLNTKGSVESSLCGRSDVHSNIFHHATHTRLLSLS